MKTHSILQMVVLSLIMLGCVQAQEFIVIVNKANPIESLTKTELNDIFLKKELRWKSGEKIQPVNIVYSSELREIFTRSIHQKTVNQIRSFWQQSIYSGKQVQPIELTTETQMMAFVRDHIYSIGYVSSGATLLGAKKITIRDE